MKRDIAWFLDLYQNEQLNLDPPYQRRSVWTGKDRKFFLDTIFRRYPCPAVFLHKEIDAERGRMIYHVVDGKQRLETIILFSRNDIAIDRDYGDERLNGNKWKQIEHDPDVTQASLAAQLGVAVVTVNWLLRRMIEKGYVKIKCA